MPRATVAPTGPSRDWDDDSVKGDKRWPSKQEQSKLARSSTLHTYETAGRVSACGPTSYMGFACTLPRRSLLARVFLLNKQHGGQSLGCPVPPAQSHHASSTEESLKET